MRLQLSVGARAVTTSYVSVGAFYSARGGAHSGELDFGVMWTDRPARWPLWRVSVVHDTGDVYASASAYGKDGGVVLLGTVGAPGCPAIVSGRHPASCPYTVAEKLLDGWTEQIGAPGSLGWVRARVGAG